MTESKEWRSWKHTTNPEVLISLLERDGAESEICPWCDRRMKFGVRARRERHLLSVSIDHIVPQVNGGMWNLANLVLACFECNQRRGLRPGFRKLPEAPWPPPAPAVPRLFVPERIRCGVGNGGHLDALFATLFERTPPLALPASGEGVRP